jgi:hypothetical protein
MNHIYRILDTLKETLRNTVGVNTVTFGDVSDVDLDKTTIFPLSHIVLGDARHLKNIIEFDIKVIMADLVDVNNKQTEGDDFYGNNNLQDALNTQFEVGNRLVSLMMRGDLFKDYYQVTTTPTLTPFIDRFSNVLAGYELNVTIQVKNGISIC